LGKLRGIQRLEKKAKQLSVRGIIDMFIDTVLRINLKMSLSK
jgi:hypothetical protein